MPEDVADWTDEQLANEFDYWIRQQQAAQAWVLDIQAEQRRRLNVQ